MRFLFPGPIPFSVHESVEWNDVNVLDLERNQLTGPIPTAFGNYSNLVYLLLSDNKLTGTPLSFSINLCLIVEVETCLPYSIWYEWYQSDRVTTCLLHVLTFFSNTRNNPRWIESTGEFDDFAFIQEQAFWYGVHLRSFALNICMFNTEVSA